MKQSSNSQHKGRILYHGDIIALHGAIPGFGYLCTPSSSEPLPEREETISHLRASSSAADETGRDFTERCMFRIADEKGQTRPEPIQFGSIVRLIHEPSGCTVIASDVVDYNYTSEARIAITRYVNI